MGSDEEILAPAQSANPLITHPINTPPRAASPPMAIEKRRLEFKAAETGLRNDRESSMPRSLDANALNKALLGVDDGRRHRDITPGGSPSRKRQRVWGDRFIPNREGRDLQASYNLHHDEGSPATPSKTKQRTPHGELHYQKSKYATRNVETGFTNFYKRKKRTEHFHRS